MPTLGTVHGFAPNLLRVDQPAEPVMPTDLSSTYTVRYADDTVARLDADGVWVADLGSAALVTGTLHSTAASHRTVAGTPSLRVFTGVLGIGSPNNNGTIRCTVVGGATTTRVGSSTVKIQTQSLIVSAGLAYWLELERDASDTSIMRIYLYSAESDMASPTLIHTTEIDHSGVVVAPTTTNVSLCAVTDDGYIVYLSVDASATDYLVNCSTGAVAVTSPITAGVRGGLPAADGRAYGRFSTAIIGKTTAAGTVAIADHWPTAFGTLASFTTEHHSMSEDGWELSHFKQTGAVLVHDFIEEPWGASPRRAYTVANHPTSSSAPQFVGLRDSTLD